MYNDECCMYNDECCIKNDVFCSGGSEIPAEYGGKDATEFWNEIHGHLEAEILEDLVEGEGFNTGARALLMTILGNTVGGNSELFRA